LILAKKKTFLAHDEWTKRMARMANVVSLFAYQPLNQIVGIISFLLS